MERISIFNYEAFYLDFLEGNLNEADTALFLEFLEANPDLRMEDDLLPSFEEEKVKLDDESKLNLKQPLFTELISKNNIEYFLIAQAEGLLDTGKNNEVDIFLKNNSVFTKDKELLSTVYFQADESIIFNEKDSLKRRRAVILWPYYAAAASVLVALLVWYSNSNSNQNNSEPLFAEEFGDVITDEAINNKTNDSTSLRVVPTQQEVSNSTHLPIAKQHQVDVKKSLQKKEDLFKKPLKPKVKEELNETPILISFDNKKPEPVLGKTLSSEELTPDESLDYASTYFGNVDNPIAPITSFIGKKINTDVDFRRKKKTEENPGSFYVKIGKFEFSRKKH